MEKKEKERERYWMETLKTVEHYVLNIADIVQLAHTLFCMSIDCYFLSIIIFLSFYYYSSPELLYLATI